MSISIYKTVLNMFTNLTINVIRFFTESGWISKVLALIILWLSPALELFLLLIGFISIDYVLETYKIWIKRESKESCKKKLWENSKMFVTKIIFYSIMVLVLNALQLHLIKEVFDIYRWVIAIPIIGEAFSIIVTIEMFTGMKLVNSIKKVFKQVFSRSGLDEEIIDELSKGKEER